MNYKEEVKDLFAVPDDYYLAHCIGGEVGYCNKSVDNLCPDFMSKK